MRFAALTWSNVDRQNGIVTLKAGETKNGEAGTVYFDLELRGMIQKQWDNRKRNGKIVPHVFPNIRATGPIVNVRKAWNIACRKAGLGYGYKTEVGYVKKWREKLPAGPIFHDFRRTAVRNMVRSGIPERVAMMVSGHKTRSVFDRYNIVSDADLKMAAQRQEEYLKSVAGTISDFEQKKGQP